MYFTAVYNGGTTIQIAEIKLQTCGGGTGAAAPTWTTHVASDGPNGNMDSDAPTTITLDKEDVLSFTSTRSSSATLNANIVLSVESNSWASTEAWKCTSVEPPWYWILPEFIDTDPTTWFLPEIIRDDDANTLTLIALPEIIRDDTKCSSSGNDCCACDKSLKMDTCNFDEPATCKDGYVPVNSEDKDGSCKYRCYKTAADTAPSTQQWCRSALANQPDVLTLWDSRYGTKKTRLLPKGGVTQFQITGYSGTFKKHSFFFSFF